MHAHENVIILVPIEDGDYSIKAGYGVLSSKEDDLNKDRALSFYWNRCALPKAGFFSWLACRKCPLTTDRLEKFNITQRFTCLLYHQALEDANHIFLQCDLFQNL